MILNNKCTKIRPLTNHYQSQIKLWHEIWNNNNNQNRFENFKQLNNLIMKKITLLVASFMLATFATNAAEIINVSGSNLDFVTRFNHDEPIQFSERGIDFFVFPNGEFDFNSRPSCNNGDYYFKTAGRRSFEVNNCNAENYGVRIERDNFGRIRRIGNTFINYDFQDRVARIGSVFLRYNRFALIQIGGLQLVYNRFGELINTFGCVKQIRFNGFTNANYTYYGNGNSNYNEDYQQNGDDEFNDNGTYYYRTDGKKVKNKDKKDKNSEDENSGRR